MERHAGKAEGRGVEVLKVRFERSEHCCHVREDGGRYWGGVRWTLRQSGVHVNDGGEVETETEKRVEVVALTAAQEPPPVSTTEVHAAGSCCPLS